MMNSSNEDLVASEKCLELIKGFEKCRLKAYLDTRCGRVWTIAWGHTSGATEGEVCTQAQADAWLAEDVRNAENIVKKHVQIALTQCQFDALVSFVYNVGPGSQKENKSGFVQLKNGRPSTMLRYLNNGLIFRAAAEFPKWKYDNGIALKGLEKRRLAEQRLFMGIT